MCKGGDGGPPDKGLVTGPSLDMIISIKDYARKRVEAGELNLEPLADYMASLSEHELTQVMYHSNFRKMIVHKQLVDKATKRVLLLLKRRFLVNADDHLVPVIVVVLGGLVCVCIFPMFL